MVPLSQVRSMPQIARLLAVVCDFDLARTEDDHRFWHLSPPMASTIIAGDSTGSQFVAYGIGPVEDLPVMYVSSEGRAGRLAKDCTELLQILIGRPDWQDLLKFSAGGQLTEMRQSAELLSRDRDLELPNHQRALFSALWLEPLGDPIAALHAAVSHGIGHSVLGKDETPFEQLFNRFGADTLRRWFTSGLLPGA
jgi:hypothetical protein